MRRRAAPRSLLLLAAALTLSTGAAKPDPLIETLAQADFEMVRSEDDLRRNAAALRELQGRLSESDERALELEHSLQERRERMERRVVRLYRLRQRGFLNLLFSARSPHDLLRTARALWWIVRADHKQLESWSADRQELDELRLRIQRDRLVVADHIADATERREMARAARADLRTRQPSPSAASRAPVRSASRRNTVLIEVPPPPDADLALDLRDESPPLDLPTQVLRPRSVFERSRGALPMPVVGPVRRAERGLEIAGDEGAAVRAIHDGEVLRVEPIAGFGQVAIMDHGDGWRSVYGNAGSLDVVAGQWLRSGEVLGHLGPASAPRGGRLYFELRHGTDVAPALEWLKVPAALSPDD